MDKGYEKVVFNNKYEKEEFLLVIKENFIKIIKLNW